MFNPVIDEHEVVTHFSNINALSRFVWWRDGEQQASFEPMSPAWDLESARKSPTAESSTVLQLIPQVGGIDVEESEEPRTDFFHIEGCFALAERLTGIEVTKEMMMMMSADFTVALVPAADDTDASMHELPPRVPLTGERATWVRSTSCIDRPRRQPSTRS